MIRGSGKKVIFLVEGMYLGVNVGIIVNDSRLNLRLVGEFMSFFVNLRDKFLGRGKNKGGGVDFFCFFVVVVSVLFNGRSGRIVGEEC